MAAAKREKQYNPFNIKAKKISKIYWGTIISPFVVGLFVNVGGGLFGSLQGIILFIPMMAAGIALVLFIPYVCYLVYLFRRAKIYNIENSTGSSTYESVNTSGSKDFNISATQEIKYRGHEHKDYGPWAGVFIMMFILPPLGLYMAVMKALTDPSHYLENGVILESVGMPVGIIGIALAALQHKIFDGFDNLPLMAYYIIVMPVIIGVVMYAVGKSIQKKGLLIAKCQKLIWIDGILKLSDIGEKLHLNYGETVRVIQTYINKGFLFSCFIDYKLKTVVAPIQYPKEAVKCKGCGGTTVKIRGLAAVCSYCGRNI